MSKKRNIFYFNFHHISCWTWLFVIGDCGLCWRWRNIVPTVSSLMLLYIGLAYSIDKVPRQFKIFITRNQATLGFLSSGSSRSAAHVLWICCHQWNLQLHYLWFLLVGWLLYLVSLHHGLNTNCQHAHHYTLYAGLWLQEFVTRPKSLASKKTKQLEKQIKKEWCYTN